MTDPRYIGAKIPAELYDRLDRYWHQHRLPSRSYAIVRALEWLIEDNETPDDRQLRRRLTPRKARRMVQP
jgi:metal-responsive CopG/Arc/MetJ family transcriptional regulator